MKDVSSLKAQACATKQGDSRKSRISVSLHPKEEGEWKAVGPGAQHPSPCNYTISSSLSIVSYILYFRFQERKIVKLAPRAFPRQPFSQNITHDPLPLPIASTLLISLGNPGPLVIVSSFICFTNIYPSMPQGLILPASILQCQEE